jgi:glycosyltransferase involved in cell wall biosynthesis
MPSPIQELRILHTKYLYPDIYGGNLRTLNIARLAQGVFGKTTVFSMDDKVNFEGSFLGIPVIQEKELPPKRESIRDYFHALTAKVLTVPYTQRAFDHSDLSLFQIEDPSLYPLLKKNHICRFILDEHNVNWELPHPPQTDLKKKIYAKIASRREKENEKQALHDADHILCCSTRDRDILMGGVPEIDGKISVIPNCVNIRDYDAACRAPEPGDTTVKERQVLFVGTLSYQPNMDAVRLICKDIAPQCPDCVFIIVGINPPKIPYPHNVKRTGYLPDVRPVLAGADICIAPICSGSGTRLKILEYMAMGKPVISTSKGAEGIDYTHGLNIVIEDEIERYPEIIHQLVADETRCSDLGRNALKLVREKYDWQIYRKSLEKIYQDMR